MLILSLPPPPTLLRCSPRLGLPLPPVTILQPIHLRSPIRTSPVQPPLWWPPLWPLLWLSHVSNHHHITDHLLTSFQSVIAGFFRCPNCDVVNDLHVVRAPAGAPHAAPPAAAAGTAPAPAGGGPIVGAAGPSSPGQPWYAVTVGRQVGVYQDWWVKPLLLAPFQC